LLGLMPWSRSYFINHIFEKNAERVFSRQSVFIHRNRSTETKNSINDEPIEGEFWEDNNSD